MAATATLMVHSGGFKLQYDELANLPVPVGTDTWRPISHYTLVQAIHEEAVRRNIVITREEFAYQPKRDMLVGIMVLNWKNTDEFATALAFKHANDRMNAIKLYAGVRVFACDNTSVSGDAIIMKKKHTKHLNLLTETSTAMDKYQEGSIKLIESIDNLKTQKVSTDNGKQLIFDIFRRQIVPIRLFHPVAEQWLLPITEENMWSLHNCFTEPIKKLKPVPFIVVQNRLGQYFGLGKDAFVGSQVVQDDDAVIDADFDKID